MEKINLGSYKVCKSWSDVTLLMWSNYLRKLAEKENEQLDLIELLETFSDIPHDIILKMPQSLFENVLSNLRFLTKEEIDDKPNNIIEINGETYRINTDEELKVQEYLDVNTVINSDKFNYPYIFAILCRKVDENYDDDFKSKVFSDRVDIFEEVSITKVYPLITFFLTLYVQSKTPSLNYSILAELRKEAEDCLSNIKHSLRITDYITPSKVPQILTLYKLEKSINYI